MTRLSLQNKLWETSQLDRNSLETMMKLEKRGSERSSSSDVQREKILRERKNSDSEVDFFAHDDVVLSKKSAGSKNSLCHNLIDHLLIKESSHLTRSSLDKSHDQWLKPPRSVAFDDSLLESVDGGADAEGDWTPVVSKRRMKKLRDRRTSMNSDEGVGDLSWSSGGILGDSRSPGVMVGDISITSHLYPDIPSILFKPKHPLGQAWTLWFRHQPMPVTMPPTVGWSTSHQLVGTVATVEDFWQLHQLIKPPSCLALANDYAMFRQGVNPDWDDPANCAGGRWVVRRERGQDLDSAWLALLYLVLGDHLGEQAQVTGVVASRRKKGDRVSVWLRDARRLGAVVDVGRMVRDRLNMGSDARLLFSVHREQKEAEKEGADVLPPLVL